MKPDECKGLGMLHDAFICHATEDKEAFVRPLAQALEQRHLDIWYDEFSLRVGDGLRVAIDRGLAGSRYGIVVFSPAFFSKPWTQWELDGLLARQLAEDRSLILPVWYNIEVGEIRAHSPPLANLRAVRSSLGIDHVCSELLRTVRPVESPLLAAQRELIRFGCEPPAISDEWWLDVVEAQEQLQSGNHPGHWHFPLPEEEYGVQGARRGRNIAWAALQLDWQNDAEHHMICQTSRPEEVWAFIGRNPALHEACTTHPALLANYAPQLLIPAFSEDFSEAFDELLATSVRRCKDWPEEYPKDRLCARRLSLRHPTFGDNELSEVADKWVNGFGGERSARLHKHIDYLFWLLARDSDWLPRKHHGALLSGMRSWAVWSMDLEPKEQPELWEGLYSKKRRTLGWIRKVRTELTVWAAATVHRLGLRDDPAQVAERFIDSDIVGGFDEHKLMNIRLRAQTRLNRTQGPKPRK